MLRSTEKQHDSCLFLQKEEGKDVGFCGHLSCFGQERGGEVRPGSKQQVYLCSAVTLALVPED